VAHGHWLVKTEPGTFSFERLVREGGTCWDGVRNHQARNHLAAMGEGDLVLVYHSGSGKEVVGIARVRRTAYPDPTASDPRWVAVDLEPVRSLVRPVALAEVRADARLGEIALVRHSRLSVMPLRRPEFDRILALGKTPASGL
jgi:predicted RNA-binding protein with PUA-like domain